MKKLIYTTILGLIGLISVSAKASFQLETMTVILDAGEERKVFSVKIHRKSLFYYQRKFLI